MKISMIKPEPEKTVDNKLQLLQHLSEVQSRIKTDITSDFTLAKLNEKQKEAITEMINNAYLMKRIFERIKLKTEKDKQHIIQEISNNIFDTYMTRPYATAVLQRNEYNNPLLFLMAETPQEPPLEEEEMLGIKEKIKKATKSEKRENE